MRLPPPARSWMVLALVLLAAVLPVRTASAAEVCAPAEPPELSLAERIDKAFGDWLVTPLANALFFDLAFWDNHLPMGTLPDEPDVAAMAPEDREDHLRRAVKKRDPEVVGFREGEGYVYRCRHPARLRDVTPVLSEGATLRRGVLTLTLVERDGRVMGTWEATPVDLQSVGLVPAEGTDPDAPRPGTTEPVDEDDGGEADAAEEGPRELARVSLEALAPFPVVVDLTRAEIRPGEVEIPRSAIPVQPSDRVRHEGEVYEVAAMTGKRLGLRTLEDEVDDDPLPNPDQIDLPLVVVWLVVGAVFFTLRFGFVNLRAFGHAILVTAGRYDHEGDEGEVSHFQALSSALSATVGLGNIAGVAVAVSAGGPGAVVWMVIAAFFGMSSKFTEVTLGQMYRKVQADGTVLGGPMRYLYEGLKERKLGGLGMVLAVVFSVMAIGGSLGGGNMFQGNQSFQALADVAPMLKPAATGSVVFERLPGEEGAITIPARTAVQVSGGPAFLVTEEAVIPADQATSPQVVVQALRGGYAGNVEAGTIRVVAGIADAQGRFEDSPLDDQVLVTNPAATAGGGSYGLFYGILLTVVVGLVIVGGIRRIGATAGYIVPAMGVIYVIAGVAIIVSASVSDPGSVLEAAGLLLRQAFTLEAGVGGLLGVLITGFQRASFSNEAGVGSASIAHSAAATSEPVREGVVALLEPFIDTVIVCTITGLVVVVTDAWQIQGIDGITMTSAAFDAGLPGARYVLALAVTLFAFSTMISWSYYGDRAATWLFGPHASLPYKGVFLLCVLLGPVFTLGNVIGFSDLMVLGMAFPNILGMYFLTGRVGSALSDYLGKLRSGAFDPE
jgi:Na+/alanine symporter